MLLLTHQHHLGLCLCLFCFLSRAYAPLLPPTAAAPVPEARLSCGRWIFQRLDAFVLLNIYFRVRAVGLRADCMHTCAAQRLDLRRWESHCQTGRLKSGVFLFPK